MKQFGNPPLSKRTSPFQLTPYFWAIFSWPPLCPNFKNKKPPLILEGWGRKLCVRLSYLVFLHFQYLRLEKNLLRWRLSFWKCKLRRSYYITATATAWKVSKYGVISGPYFLAFGLNTERYSGKYGAEITPYLDTFHAVHWPPPRLFIFDQKWEINLIKT